MASSSWSGAEQRVEAQPDVLVCPACIELAPQVLDREVRGRDVLRLQHGLQPPLGERAGEQLPLLMQRDLVATPRRCGDRRENAGHCQRHDQCDREDGAGTERPRPLLAVAESGAEHLPHDAFPGCDATV